MRMIDYKVDGDKLTITKKELEDNYARLVDVMSMHMQEDDFNKWLVAAGEREVVISLLKLFDHVGAGDK